MDAQNSDQRYAASNVQQQAATYPYITPQPDPFNAFVNTDDGPGFDQNWSDQPFQSQASIDHYEQPNHGWQAESYQAANLLPMRNYESPTREFDQGYPRNPTSFNNYPGFEQAPVQSYVAPTYNESMVYGQIPMSDRFDFNGDGHYGRSHETTISPQALQANSTIAKSGSAADRPDQAYGRLGESNGNIPTIPRLQPLNRQDWARVVAENATSISVKGLHIKPTQKLSRATNSLHLGGYYFVGNEKVALSSKLDKIPPFKRRRSRNELSALLNIERGDGQLHKDRKSIVKRLEEAAKKAGGPAKASRDASAVPSGSSSDSDDSESDNESDSGSDSEVEEPSPVPLARPTNPNKAIEYDIIKTVWARRKAVLSGTVIRTALRESWVIFVGIRDQWKTKIASLQQSIEKKDKVNQKAWERRVGESRDLVEACVQHTLQHGHPSIVEKLCENPQLLAIFYQFMADRIKEKDLSSSLIISILQLVVKCNSITNVLMEKTKMDKLLLRLVAKGDTRCKTLAQKILDNAEGSTNQKSATRQLNTVAKQDTQRNASSKLPTTEPARASKGPGLGTKLSAGQVDTKPAVVKTGDDRQLNGKSDSSKVKVVQTPMKASGFFAGLQSASKKPGTSSKTKDGKSVTEAEHKTEDAKPAPKAAFSFAATMANLQKQKDSPPVKTEDSRQLETSEDKGKRLRRESRRGLRVSFKADNELVQTRIFVHDPDEELGHEDSQVRDVMDSKGEGQTLKMHKDMDFMDEDEDYEPPEEFEPLSIWCTPQPVDFSPIEKMDVPLDSIYKKRGGTLEPDSVERAVQQQRELDTLMVVYSTLADVPKNPRDPPDIVNHETVDEQRFGEPLSDSFVKAREVEYRSNRYAQPATLATLSGLPTLYQSTTGSNDRPPQFHSQNSSDSAAANQAAANLANIQAILAQVKGNQPPTSTPPVAPAFNLQAAMNNVAQSNPYQPQYQPQQTFEQSQPVQGAVDLQALLKNLGGPQSASAQGLGYNADLGRYQTDNDRKRQLEDNDQDEYGQGKRAKVPGREEKKPFNGIPTVACKYFQEGKCRKGAECTFLHIME